MNPTHPDVGSRDWQPGHITSHQGELSTYLERVFAHPVIKQAAARALDMLALEPGQSVLEVGCGNGVFLPLLAQAVGPSGRVVGIDHSEAFVAEANAKMADAGLAGTVTVLQADAYGLPFEPATFDAAHCERVLIHLDDPSAALAEMKRVVRPGGWIVAAESEWGALRIDHADRAGMDLLCARHRRTRQPDAGLTLYRRMGELGLTDRLPVPMLAGVTDIEVLWSWTREHGWLATLADQLVADGTLTRTRADSLLAGIDTAVKTGRFYCTVPAHIVAGRVPS